MIKAYKIEIKPTLKQRLKIDQTINVCRFIYNFYIAHNKTIYEKEKRFVTGFSFSKWLNNEFIPSNPNYSWIKEVSSKSAKESIMRGEKAFKRFFKKQSAFPKFKKKGKSNVSIYFPKNNKTDFTVQRHRIKVPTLGFVRLKEYGYLAVNAVVKSATIKKQCDRYYINVLVQEEVNINNGSYSDGIGIDLGLKHFAVCSDKQVFENINKSEQIRKLTKSLKRQQRKLSRKCKMNKKRKERATKNIQKQQLKVQKIYQRITNIRIDHINKIIDTVVKTKPRFINLEDLNISGMMKNRHLSKAIMNQCFYLFKIKLLNKCKIQKIEFRISKRFFPSSKLCSNCGSIKKGLKLKDRTYHCEHCGLIIDRDYNACINLKNNKDYTIM